MKTSELEAMALVLSLFAASVVVAGCDAESSDPDAGAFASDDDGETTETADADDDDDDDGARPALGLRAPGAPSGGASPLDAHPCGNAVIDPGEECDDGLANGAQRECTMTCELNECELDAAGYCEDHWPAADVDLYPCAELPTDHDGCELGIAAR